MEWITEGYDGFSKGTMGNGGQNIYVSRKGVLQRIFQYDLNMDGHPDLIFASSQSMYERPPVHVYTDLPNSREAISLPSGGTYDGIFEDLNGDGFDDLVIACQHNGTHSDVTAFIYYGSSEGLSEKQRMELPVPNSIGVCAGDFNGDGTKDLAFLSNGRIRVFYQEKRGFVAAAFQDYPIAAVSVTAADIDGDGFCDLYFKDTEGNAGILFGSKDGLCADRIKWLNSTPSGTHNADRDIPGGSTAGLNMSYTEWRVAALQMNEGVRLFAVKDGKARLYSCDAQRNITETHVFSCENPVAAVAADLTGDGHKDIVFVSFVDRDTEADCTVYFGSDAGFSEARTLKIPVKGAVNVAVADMNGPVFIFCRTGERVEQEVPCPIYRLIDKRPVMITEVVGGDCMSILPGYPMGRNQGVQIAVLNHKMNQLQGGENILIYLGGENGYTPERRLELPGHSSVEGVMCDFFDKGNVDVLVCNCFEDAAHLDEGSYIYINNGSGLDINRKEIIPTIRAHGVAVGDFRKSGYIDLAFGGFNNREIRIFHGSENGYSLDNSTQIVLGPDDGTYQALRITEGVNPFLQSDPEEQLRVHEYGQVRWMLAADFNQDGWLDLLVTEIVGSRCYILWGGPDGFSFDRRTELLTDGVAYGAVADLNGNGWPDLILSQHQSTKKTTRFESYVTVYWGGPDGYQEHRKMQLPVNCANSVTVGDYNGNGSLDIYATSYNNGRTRDLLSYLYKGDHGDYSIHNVQYLFNHSGCGCVSGDFNGDGYTDLAVACHKEYGNHCSHSFIFWGGPDGLSEDRKTVLPTVGPHGMSTIDPGNIMDRGDKEYYISEAFSLPEGNVVRSILWEGVCTSTSWVETEMRSGYDFDSVQTAEWKKVDAGKDIRELGLSGVVQYRLALCAKCACGTPRINKVTVTY